MKKRTAKTVKASAGKRTLNPTNQDAGKSPKPGEGAPLNDQDPKRRAGDFEGAGEFTRTGVRGK